MHRVYRGSRHDCGSIFINIGEGSARRGACCQSCLLLQETHGGYRATPVLKVPRPLGNTYSGPFCRSRNATCRRSGLALTAALGSNQLHRSQAFSQHLEQPAGGRNREGLARDRQQPASPESSIPSPTRAALQTMLGPRRGLLVTVGDDSSTAAKLTQAALQAMVETREGLGCDCQ